MSVRSMTGYGSAERDSDAGLITGEMRSVNHRFLELTIKLPDDLRVLEPQLREKVSARVQRGKVDLGLRLRSTATAAASLRVNDELLDQLSTLATTLGSKFPGLRTEFSELLRFPGVIDERPADLANLHEQALALADELIDGFIASREREGDKLAAAMRERLDAIAVLAAKVREWLPEIRAALKARLEAKLAEFSTPIDPGRVEQELVLGLQKLDVDEELDRLAAHVDEARRVLDSGEPIGRRLDFLMQEFNREANTLGSKSVDPRTSQLAVDLKVLIEQLREQVQNLE